jgi:membrane-bound lytic murein transglycosylase D
MRCIGCIGLLFGIYVSSLSGESLSKKYPSYSYVFNEFDVDESYIYDEAFISFVKNNERKMKRFYTRSLKRGESILPTIQGLLVGDGVSDLFIYLSMVESGFSTNAISSKKAVGLWQFMPATAKQYKLTVCSSYDERCDTSSATTAAINYLNKLHKQFGKWYLAAMAYNCGEGCVQKAIKKAGSDELYILTDNTLKYLPSETRKYIKKILLVAMIGENLTLDFGQHGNDVLIQVEVRGGTSLTDIANLLKMDSAVLFNLNKGIKDGVLPQIKKTYKITIPIEKMYAFYLRYEIHTEIEVPQKDKSHMVTYVVKLGDTLEKIAQIHGTKSEEIMLTNHLENEALLLDSMLVIPVSKEKFENLSQ